MLNMKNLKQISMDGPNMNWKFFDCFINERKYEELPSLINIGSCSLHVLNNTFKTGANATRWNLHKLMKACFQILHDSPARREDCITIHSSGSTPPPPLLKGGGGKFWLPSPALFLFIFFKVYHFYIYKLLYPLAKLCYVF